MIWYGGVLPDLKKVNLLLQNGFEAHCGMNISEFTEREIHGEFTVDHRTRQPFGLLHGGVSAAFCETLGSLGGNLCLDQNLFFALGLEINANHIRSVKNGSVFGAATPLHLGRSTQVWDCKLRNLEQELVCVARLTLAVKKAQGNKNDE